MLGETSINHPPEISVIVPFKYRKGDPACLIRLSRAISCFANRNGVEVVVYDTSSLSISKRVQKNINFPGIRYFHCSESSVF